MKKKEEKKVTEEATEEDANASKKTGLLVRWWRNRQFYPWISEY
jgi:hypothetical protein